MAGRQHERWKVSILFSSKWFNFLNENLIIVIIFLSFRDLGKFIRDKVKAAFETNNKQNLDSEHCNRQYNTLNKIADNYYRDKYKRTRHSTGTGLSTEECNIILSSEVLDYLKEENKGFFGKIFNKD